MQYCLWGCQVWPVHSVDGDFSVSLSVQSTWFLSSVAAVPKCCKLDPSNQGSAYSSGLYTLPDFPNEVITVDIPVIP